ncbi:hypothetical protein ACRRTK_020458 [Alexandromys fortis]
MKGNMIFLSRLQRTLVSLLEICSSMQVKDIDEGIDRDIFDINEGLGLDLFEGDIRFEPQGKNSIIGDIYRWPHTIPYVLDDSLDMNAKGVILNAFERYRLKTCIDFKPWSGEANYISVFKGSGCWSYVGNSHVGKQELSIGENCDRIATVQHEFLHALGFWHEQSRSDRDDYVTIVWDRILSGREHNFNIYNDSVSDSLNVPYDYTSVMHYSKTAFQNGTEPTIVTKISDFENVIGQRMDFSDYDLLKLNHLYNCSSSLSFMDSCDFELENICGMIQNSEDNADWQRVSQVSTGPENDHSNMGQCIDSGFFMHFDTSSANVGDTAMLESRMLYPKRGFQCLEFYLYNSGSENNQVKIYTREYTAGHPDGVLTLQREIQGYAYQAYLDLNSSTNVGIYFYLISGANDDQLQWPCPWQQATMTLLDQNPDIRQRNESYFWDRPSKLGNTAFFPNGTQYYRTRGYGTSAFITYERLKSREFIKGDDVYILLTVEDISHLNSTSTIPVPTLIVPDPVPTSNVHNSCSEVECQNGGICTVQDNRAECRCPAGEDWWYMGRLCEKRGSTQDTVVIAVSSTVAVFVVMLIITLVSVYCTRRKYRKKMSSDSLSSKDPGDCDRPLHTFTLEDMDQAFVLTT